jgi:hypothetical protein
MGDCWMIASRAHPQAVREVLVGLAAVGTLLNGRKGRITDGGYLFRFPVPWPVSVGWTRLHSRW